MLETVKRAALLQTTNTMGWSYVKEVANEVVTQSTQDALDEENPIIGESKRLKAKALQAGFRDFFALIEICRSPFIDDEADRLSELDPYGDQELANGK